MDKDNSTTACLGIFLKEPVPGRVKTRLTGALSADDAAAMYEAFVADTVTLALNSSARHCILFHAGSPPSTWLEGEAAAQLCAAIDSSAVSEQAQAEGNLGERLQNAFAGAGRTNSLPLLVIGSDSPDLPSPMLNAALASFQYGAEAVLGPATDGGVWCIGLREAATEFFANVPWSSAETGLELRNRAGALGLKLHEADLWHDCDTPADLAALANRLRTGSSQANMTSALLDELGA